MTTKYARHVSKRQTAQTDQAREDQVENNAGGYVFQVDKWKALDRFLILGTEGGSYYCSEKEMTVKSTKVLDACLTEDYKRTVDRIVEISYSGRAPKNDPAIFALARAASVDSFSKRSYALAQLSRVCRIGTHLFQFVEAVEEFRGWGHGLRKAIGKWYNYRSAPAVMQQVTKYVQRRDWSHRDLLRKCHVKPIDADHEAIFRWVVAQKETVGPARTVKSKGRPDRHYGEVQLNPYLVAFDELKVTTDPNRAITLIEDHEFTHEMLPTELKRDKRVWEALLQKMPMTAMIRNLGKMTSVGLIAPLSSASQLVADRITDVERLKKARVHPIALLVALLTYRQGHGDKGALTWDADPKVIDALDAAFYLAFQNVVPTDKSRLVALDISGSMGTGSVAGCANLTPRIASAALAMITVRTEKDFYVVGFTSPDMSRGKLVGGRWGGNSGLTAIDLTKSRRLDDAVDKVSNLPMGGTDCSLPMVWATENKVAVDSFEIYTDNETWAGDIHPYQALQRYREKMGKEASLVVNAMTATEFTIADPRDPRMLDVCGFDTAAPALMADFIRGEL